jgi:hypothetical protein
MKSSWEANLRWGKTLDPPITYLYTNAQNKEYTYTTFQNPQKGRLDEVCP